MQHRRSQLPADALAERELADRRADERIEVERLTERGQGLAVAVRGHAVHVPEQLQRVDERQIPPELDPLAEHHPHPPRQRDALVPRHQTAHRHAAGRRHEDPRQHLDGGRLAGAVRPDVAEDRPALDREGQILDGVDGDALATEPSTRTVDDEVLGHTLELDERHRYPPALW